jgi:hypothetical protein
MWIVDFGLVIGLQKKLKILNLGEKPLCRVFADKANPMHQLTWAWNFSASS